MSHSSLNQRSPPYAGTHAADSDMEKKQVSDLEKTEVTDIQEGIVEEAGLRRALLGRHISLISLSSVIGASCFFVFGNALQESGPLGALIGIGVVGMCSPAQGRRCNTRQKRRRVR